jgi:hypothetical protein
MARIFPTRLPAGWSLCTLIDLDWNSFFSLANHGNQSMSQHTSRLIHKYIKAWEADDCSFTHDDGIYVSRVAASRWVIAQYRRGVGMCAERMAWLWFLVFLIFFVSLTALFGRSSFGNVPQWRIFSFSVSLSMRSSLFSHATFSHCFVKKHGGGIARGRCTDV